MTLMNQKLSLLLLLVVVFLGRSASAGASILPPPRALEAMECRAIVAAPDTLLLRANLGWWGRGYILGALSAFETANQLPEGRLLRQAEQFNLSAETAAAHIGAYCTAHPSDTPFEAIAALLFEILREPVTLTPGA
jgi:hypothetical protein